MPNSPERSPKWGRFVNRWFVVAIRGYFECWGWLDLTRSVQRWLVLAKAVRIGVISTTTFIYLRKNTGTNHGLFFGFWASFGVDLTIGALSVAFGKQVSSKLSMHFSKCFRVVRTYNEYMAKLSMLVLGKHL